MIRRAMAPTADAIIIGAGIMGAATAYHLARRKYGRVIVLERDGVCSGSPRWPPAASATSTPTASASS